MVATFHVLRWFFMERYDKDGNKIYEIVISVEKFKEVLLYSWELLPREMQVELVEMGIYPKKVLI